MTAVHVYIGACTYYIYYSKGVSDAVDKSDCYGANLIDILKFQIQIFYICQKIYVIIIIYIYIINSYNIKTKEIKKKLVKITII